MAKIAVDICVVMLCCEGSTLLKIPYMSLACVCMLDLFMKLKEKAVQLAMHCRCGRETMLANGMCATCYTLRRQDEEHFGGLRETVLERDGYRCRVCDAPGTSKRSMVVHHCVPGWSELKLMIALCPACHARVHRTKAVLAAMPPLLLVLWREQHPRGHEQKQLDFKKAAEVQLRAVPLF